MTPGEWSAWIPPSTMKAEFASAKRYFEWAEARREALQRGINLTDAAAECEHGRLPGDTNKPEWCLCWADPGRVGAVAEGAR